jgi:N6-adenosine-specific RNA methylase IME4
MSRSRSASARVIVADPPWPFKDKLRQDKGIRRGAADVYRNTMTLQEIMMFRRPPIADDAILFLWRVASMQEEALQVMRAWGFTPKSEIVWGKTTQAPSPLLVASMSDPMYGAQKIKLAYGMGRYVRNCHETCLIGRRGKGKIEDPSQRSMFFAPVGRHSEKPEEFYRIVRTLCPDGPRVSLFERQPREGFECFGDEL